MPLVGFPFKTSNRGKKRAFKSFRPNPLFAAACAKWGFANMPKSKSSAKAAPCSAWFVIPKFVSAAGLRNRFLSNQPASNKFNRRRSMPDTAKLADLPTGQSAVVDSFPSGVAGLSRLREMGLLPGVKIRLVRRAPLGDPLEISFRGSLFSLRRQEAERIEVRPEP